MKKFVALSLVLMMALALCACGNKVEQQTWKFACSATWVAPAAGGFYI